ncbi:hypothetical protein GOA90_25170 [Sinorhizobium meliloti]|nr:hypothetical protein [Sinorhizobium meliloti]
MNTIADYTAWKARQQQNGVGAAQVVIGSVNESPDEIAGDLNLASEFGKVTGNPVPPVPMVKEYRNVFQEAIEREKNKTILSKSPVLTEWLRNPDNAAIARDDLESLSWFEGFARGSANTLKRSGQRLGQAGNTYMLNQTAGRAQDRRMSFGQILESEQDVVSTAKGDVRLFPNLGDFLSASGRWIDAKYADLIGADDEGAAQEYAAALQGNIDRLKATPKSRTATEFESAAMVDNSTFGQTLQNFGAAMISNPVGALSWMLETAGEIAPQLAAAVTATIATRNPAIGLGVQGAGSYATERYISVADFLTEKGIDLGNANDVGRVLSEPELLKEANDRGVIRGGIIAAFDMASAGIAGRVLAGNPMVETIAQTIQQAISGSLGEYSARLAAGQEIDWNEIIAEGLAEVATAPIDMGVAGRRLVGDRRRARDAEGTVAQITEIGAQAQASKLRARMPDKFRQLVEAATANGPVENVFVPADQFVQYFQGIDVDPYALVDELDGVTRDDLDAALAGGGDLQIPTATYAAKIAGTDADPFFMENMRFDPDAFTAAEAAAFNERAQDALQEAWEIAESVRVEREQLSAVEDQIYDSMVSRLRTAGRSTDVATTEALLYPAFYRVMAERSGMTTEEFLGRYPLPEIQGDIPQGMQFRDVDELTRTLSETRNRRATGLDKRGPSLLEFISDYGGINDIGGELRSRNAETLKRGKGKKTLKLARGGVVAGARDLLGATGGKKFGVDDVALAAIEAGYLANEPEAIEFRAAMAEGREVPDITRALWSAIDRELSGEAQYVSDPQADEQAAEESRLDEIEAYLSTLGVSLEDDDAKIRQAIEGARQYAQGSVTTQEEVDAFADALAAELGLRSLSLFLSRAGDLKLNMIAVPKDKLGGGIGSQAMERIVDFADARGLRVTLTTGQKDDGFGTTSTARLVKFYKRFGFVENKGRNKDFSISENMYREPKPGRTLMQSGSLGPRGLIQFSAGGVGKGETIVRLFQNADLSTFLHESGHYFLSVLQDMAGRGEANATADFEAVKSWWRENAADVARDAMRVMPDVTVTADDVIAAIDNGTTGDLMRDGAIDVGMQEQWARGFEAYLMEGKAPSADLRSAFEKFRSWLISIYKRLAGLNVTISDDIRGVFDRMIATDEEIEKAQVEAGGNHPLFANAEEMGLTPEEYAGFMKLRAQAEDEAKARLLRETMAPVKRAQEKWFKDERAKVREEVEREVNAFRYFRAIEWMGNRRWFGDNQPEDMPDIRLSKSILVDRYGKGVLDTLPRGKQTVYAVEGGIDPDDAAGWFGFDSGDEMIRAMEKAPKRTEAIEAETDRVMRERHGDALNDGSVEAAALAAVHTDKRGQWIAAELSAVIDIAGEGVKVTAKEERHAARQTLARMRVRDAVSAGRFLAAERKAAEEAARLGAMLAREGVWMQSARRRIASKARAAVRGDGTVEAVAPQIERANASTGNYNETVARLIEVKRRQLVNHSLYMEAVKVADEVEKAERYVAKLGKKSTRERIAGAGRRENAQVDYLGAIDELLERYDFRRMSGAAEQRRGSLNAFVDAMKAAGRENELAIPETVLRDAARKPYKTMPVEELRGVIDSLKNLEHLATRWNDLIDAQNQRKLDEVVTDVVAAFDANLPKRPPGRVATRGEAIRNAGRQFLDLVLNAGTILREIDGFKDLGAAYRNIKTPIDEAMNRLIVRKEQAAKDLEALYAVYSKDERRRMSVREHMPALGYALSKWERIAVALNTGNAGNFQRLTDPKVRGSLTEAQVAAVLATLDERDAAFVQSVWDYAGSFWSDIAERERRTTGVVPTKVEDQPVEIAGKQLKGGYYPLKYDPRLSSLARDDEAQDLAASLQAGRFGKAQTRNGHTKARGQSSGRDVELDMSVLHRHVNQVIYDLELSEAVANSWRILQDGRVRTAFTNAGKQPDFDALEIWLKDVAEGEMKSAELVGRAARSLKSNFTAAKLALNLGTVAVQVTGLSQSMVVAGKKNMAVGIMQAAKNPIEAARDVAARSPYMKTRQTTFNKDIYDFYSDPKTGPVASRWGEIKTEYLGPLSFWLMTKVQWHLVDVPTWLAGYRQGLAEFGNDEAKAVAHADAIVKRAQASGLFPDRSAIERGSVTRTARQNDVVRLFTALASYMFAKFNVAYERTARTSRTIGQEGFSARSAQEALSWTLDMAFLFTLEAVVIAAIKGRLPDDEDEDDESWMMFLARETGFGVMGTIPFIRDIASSLSGFEGGGAYGGITKEFAAPFKQASQGEVDAALVKSVINATGLATGIPSTQINRVVDAGWRQAEGDDVSPLEYLLGRSGK